MICPEVGAWQHAQLEKARQANREFRFDDFWTEMFKIAPTMGWRFRLWLRWEWVKDRVGCAVFQLRHRFLLALGR